MTTAIHLFFAGLWPLVWHWGTPIGIIILCLTAEVVIQMFGAIPFVDRVLRPLQKDLLWVAFAAAVFLYGFSDGVKVEHARGQAKQEVLLKQIDRVVDQVTKDPANQAKPLKPGEKGILPSDKWDTKDN